MRLYAKRLEGRCKDLLTVSIRVETAIDVAVVFIVMPPSIWNLTNLVVTGLLMPMPLVVWVEATI